MFDKNVYAERRNKLKQRMRSGLLLFLGNNESPMNYPDNTYHFRQDSTFLYYFGLDYPGLAAIIDVDEDRDIVFGNDLTVDEIVWMGTQPSLKERALAAGITDTRPMADMEKMLASSNKAGPTAIAIFSSSTDCWTSRRERSHHRLPSILSGPLWTSATSKARRRSKR